MLKFGLKMPGGGFTVKQVGMDFLYASLCNNYLPGAYERLLLDAMQGDRCFTRGMMPWRPVGSLSIRS